MEIGGVKRIIHIPPEKLLVCVGGLKTKTGKLHEILTSECVGGILKLFLYSPQNC